VALLDADDLWLPNKLEDQIALLDREPSAGMLYGNYLFWYSWAGTGDTDFKPDLGFKSGSRVEPPALIPLFLRGRIALPCPSSIVARHSAIIAAEGFDGEFPNMYEDQVFLAKMCLNTQVLIYSQIWTYYRIHRHSITAGISGDGVIRARRTFLHWLSMFMDKQGLTHKSVRDAIAAELWNLEHPRRARLNRFFRKRFHRKAQVRGGTVV
jgi:hypothetical protein